MLPIKIDFVLTTLATRKQSQIFPQHIAARLRFPFWRKTCFLTFLFLYVFFLWKTTRLKNQTFSQLKTTCRLPHCHIYSILFISSHVLFIFHFLSFPTFFVIEKIIANLDHWHVDPLLSFADKKRIPNEAQIKWSIPKNGVWKSGTPFHPLLN